ncbi:MULTISPECIES: ABC transporter permease [Phyllobacteriaceae]|jgi:putative spermidine/putrescine transport system permease protein|uniref:ABC transporter permease n=1 Tax=Mesorhizobium hungaricum TaxID=1566387 RepID=A0A1C2E0Y0_9HYPH|nr:MULTISPECIES: ABC transporter permease [Mesorhizobium]MBN9235517.1 ABC transporter permease [Mesorhizobium sp.]MDQ0331329.1 putative spermidine/putrescine transport system permease protein [Mesorhizobium sp. YL-MeA3-2017]OCX20661.1 ABC transporter permease [Mesorhizobium hungaricum]
MNAESNLPISHWQRLWLYLLGGLVMLFLIAPSVIIVIMSFSGSTLLEFPPQQWSLRWYQSYFGSVEWRDATIVSVKVAIMTAIVATPLGTAAAYAVNAGTLRLTGTINAVLTASLIIPVILIGIGTFFLYARIGLNNTLTGLVIAHTVQALPLVVLTVLSGLRSYDMNQEMVARSLGAGRFAAFFQVTMPQLRFSIVSGALFAFITSFDEVVVSLFISGGETTTLTRRMFNALRDQIDPTIAAISTCLIVLSIILLSAAQLLGRGR